MVAPTCPACGSSYFEELDDDTYICCNCNNILTAKRLQQRKLLAEIIEKIRNGEELEPTNSCFVKPIAAFGRRL
jgi:uncharacterized Zn finger protein (UPF0148 family)